MKLAIMQPYWFPYIGYFQLLQAVDSFVFYDDVDYIQQGWINRNRIIVAKQHKLISIPLIKASHKKKIRDIEVCGDGIWQKKMLRTLFQSYAKAPYRSPVMTLIEQSFDLPHTSISDYATASILQVVNYLQLDAPTFTYSYQYQNTSLKGQNRVLDICKQAGCNTYINPIGGVELYDEKDFLAKGIELKFIKTQFKDYPQLSNGFIPGLSIIDVLMMNSPNRTRQMLCDFQLLPK